MKYFSLFLLFVAGLAHATTENYNLIISKINEPVKGVKEVSIVKVSAKFNIPYRYDKHVKESTALR